ncbi:MAG: LysR family transcriptional regulator, partial [Sutterella wadsworthensis]
MRSHSKRSVFSHDDFDRRDEELCRLAAQGTFSAAARALGRSQSVVSTHIAGMENELGIRLFVRGTPAKLTPAGEELLPGALRVLREAERFESRASELFRLPEPLLY